MRLVDADAFKAEGRELYRDAGWDLRDVHYSQMDVECNIDMMPTIEAVPLEDYRSMEQTVHNLTQTIAEAVPVKHGRWKHHQYGNTAGYYECDNCGKINSYESNYCPKCGARMDLNEVGENDQRGFD